MSHLNFPLELQVQVLIVSQMYHKTLRDFNVYRYVYHACITLVHSGTEMFGPMDRQNVSQRVNLNFKVHLMVPIQNFGELGPVTKIALQGIYI